MTQWHAKDVESTLTGMKASRDGLVGEEVLARLAKYGRNTLPEPPKRSSLRRFLDQFNNLLILILVVASGVTLLLGHTLDSAVIAGVVIINALVGYIQEGKAEAALAAIRTMLSPRARVRRDGDIHEVDASDIVPGDIVMLRSGDLVPADIRLIETKNLQTEEAALTGESMPTTKQVEPVAPDAGIGDRLSLTFAGTLVRTGRGTGVVVATGLHTELGRISAMLKSVQPLATPLLTAMARFARVLSLVILAAAAVIFLFGWLVHGMDAGDMFIAAVAFAVAAIPEGLPAIITITLAVGVQAMAKRNAIVRRLPAVEALGAVTVICSDKTGTLTRNEMRVQGVILNEGVTEASVMRCAILCNDARLDDSEGGTVAVGDPTEYALKLHARASGTDITEVEAANPRLDVIPFESAHRFMATLHDGFALMKGAPEAVLSLCENLDQAAWQQKVDSLASQGQRTLALAERDGSPFTHGTPGSGWRLLAIVGLIDPPRPEAIEAVAACRDAGIRVKMITGDHALTACAIGTAMGIGDGHTVLTGSQLDELDEETFLERATSVDVFARVNPAHKLRLVEALQQQGEVVAMTGDGVNDAPALKRASVGIAMGRKGTEAARGAAEIVLADDNFATITAAVTEGRRIYDNIRKAVLFILPTNAGEAMTVGVAVLLGRSLPMTPVQVLWVNMVTAVTLALALIFEPAERDIMSRPPRPPQEPMLSRILVWRTFFVGALMLVATFGMFILERAAGASIETARTVAVNTLVMCEIFYLLNSRFLTAMLTPRNAFSGNPWILTSIATVVGLQLFFTYWTPMQVLFGSTAIDAAAWIRILAAGFGLMVLVELEKWIRGRVSANGMRHPAA